MIISRRKYELEKQEAYCKGVRETEDRFYQREEIQRLHLRLDGLANEIRHMKAPTEGSTCDNAQCAKTPIPY